MRRFLAAAVQLNSLADKGANLEQAFALVDAAAARGAEVVALPENLDFIGPEGEKLAGAEALDGVTFSAVAAKAKDKGIYILAGTIAERAVVEGKARNTSVLYGPDGSQVALYRKIHLFDVDLPDGAKYRESEMVEPGEEIVLAKTPLANFGLSICYDVRFPELYRELAQRGAEVLFVPAAFTLHTGKDHWEVLLRARAIENTCFLIAPAQTGQHSANRTTYGNSMIIDPWGTVLARCADGPGFCLAEIDPANLERVRRQIPSLLHRKM